MYSILLLVLLIFMCVLKVIFLKTKLSRSSLGKHIIFRIPGYMYFVNIY